LPGLIAQALPLRLRNHSSIMIKSAVRFRPVPAGQKLTAHGLTEMAMLLAAEMAMLLAGA
jgi:hypothetical protein